MRHHAVAVLALAAATAPLGAQTATVLLKDGDQIAPDLTVTRLNRSDLNGVGGYMILAVASNSQGEKVSLAWGSPDADTPPGILRIEGTYAGLQQTSWYAQGGLDDAGRIAYRADGIGPSGVFDSIWHGDVPIAVSGDPSTLPGSPPWGGFDQVGVTESGMPWFTPFGAVPAAVNGIFVGAAATPLYASGDSVPGLPGTFWRSWRPSFSSDGAHYIATVVTADDLQVYNRALVLDGGGLFVDGELIQVGNLVPPALGGDGTDEWEFFEELVDVNAGGDWCFSGRTLFAPFQEDALIARNGQLAYMAGDVVDGVALTVQVLALDLSDRGELLHCWGPIFVDDDLILRQGDPVDFDGDGEVDPLWQFSGLYPFPTQVHLSEDGWIYLRGTVEGPGLVDCLLRIPRAPAPTSYCTPKPSSSGCAAVMRTSDPTLAPVAGAADYSVLCTSVEGLKNGLLFWGTSGPAAIPFQGGTLCVTPPLNRTAPQPSGGSSGGCDGSFALLLNDDASAPNLGPGQTAWWQAWYRDPGLGDGFDVALSNGIEIAFR